MTKTQTPQTLTTKTQTPQTLAAMARWDDAWVVDLPDGSMSVLPAWAHRRLDRDATTEELAAMVASTLREEGYDSEAGRRMNAMKKITENERNEEIKQEDIKALAEEAARAGDIKQVALCRHALLGQRAALAECARVIRAARAML